MEVTEIRVFLKEGQDKKLKAYTTVTFDNSFVVRNIKVIQGSDGQFIAMPSRKLKHPCPKCRFRNAAGSKFCNHCGTKLLGDQPVSALDIDTKAEHRDVAHPITQEFRRYLQEKVLNAYQQELERSAKAGPSPGASQEDR